MGWRAALSVLLLLQGPALQAAPAKALKLMKVGEVRAEALCNADPRNCMCEVGSVPRSFRAHNGVSYFECTPGRCPAGQVVRETRTAGGMLKAECVRPQAPEYSEPKVRSINPRAPGTR